MPFALLFRVLITEPVGKVRAGAPDEAPPMKFLLQLTITAGIGLYLLGKAMAAVPSVELPGQQLLDEPGHALAGPPLDEARKQPLAPL